jgi:hypothetical protein
MRCHTEPLLLLLVVSGAGCAFSDGDPWGVAEVSLTANFDPPPSRLDGDALITNRDFSVTIETLEIEVEALTVSLAGEDAAAEDGDCHDGHCHGEAPAPAANAGETSVALSLEGDGTPVDPRPSAPVGLETCPGGCALPRGTLSRVSATIHEIALEVVVGGRRIARDLDVEATIAGAIDETVGDGEFGVRIDATLALPPELLDDIAFDTDTSTDSISDAVRTNLEAHGRLEATTSRFD